MRNATFRQGYELFFAVYWLFLCIVHFLEMSLAHVHKSVSYQCISLIRRLVFNSYCQIAHMTPAMVYSQVWPRAIGGITTCHKTMHSLALSTVTHICMRELPQFHHGSTSSLLYSQAIQDPASGPGLLCTAGQVFIWDDDPSVTFHFKPDVKTLLRVFFSPSKECEIASVLQCTQRQQKCTRGSHKLL